MKIITFSLFISSRVGSNELMGCCAIGMQFVGPGRNHWFSMLENQRKPVAQWHVLHEQIPGLQNFSKKAPTNCLRNTVCTEVLTDDKWRSQNDDNKPPKTFANWCILLYHHYIWRNRLNDLCKSIQQLPNISLYRNDLFDTFVTLFTHAYKTL